MNFTVTVHYSGLDVELSGESREEIQQELLAFAEFAEEHADELEVFQQISRPSHTATDGADQTQATAWSDEENEQNTESCFSEIADEARVDEGFVELLFELPDDDEEAPFLCLYEFEGGDSVLGNYRNQKQAYGSVLLLYLWQECRGVEEVEKDRLDEALSFSEIDIDRRDVMYNAFSGDAQNWFNKSGGTIGLKTRGEHKARELLRDLAEDLH
ncbi:hypothetical protein EGH22_16645 [Halomicroarcula sp. F28]|uniref:hypothetical protein n=1 Tax=Haloarcula salinisoli TaxID=2487746 RepID=UPI001C72CD4A|nr:hypothetical protein [Halomicroarcula salinisoli]MBX0287963.1 hypothetical protein [Halomicroarcula salinisoli]